MNMKINMDTIIQDPNPVLRAKAQPVSLPLSEEDRTVLMTMLQYVRDSQDDELAEAHNLQPAVGIAAPQIGISKQMTAIRVVDYDDNDDEIITEYALVNPRIVSHSEKKCALANGEGCLSIRDEYAGFVPRHLRVKVKAYDALQDKEIVITLTNYLSVVVQHEIDHLHGVLFYDTINTENPWDQSNLKIIE